MAAPGSREPIPPMVSSFTAGWGILNEGVVGAEPASASWGGSDRARYQPIYVPTTCIATRMWWANGASVTGNVEAGLYYDTGAGGPGGKCITTGSTAQAGTSQIQFADITDTRLDPGVWWLFMSASSSTATILVSVPSTVYDELFTFLETSVAPGSAPATATPIETNQGIYVFGFSTNTVT